MSAIPAMRHCVLFAAEEITYHRFTRLGSLTEGWQWLLLALLCLALLTYVVHMYRRDSVELSRGISVTLVVLRLSALAFLLFYFLDLEKGTERSLIMNSRVSVAVDVSQSMGQRDVPLTTSGPAAPASAAPTITRSEAVVEALEKHELIERLRQQHDVTVMSFAEADKPTEIASFTKIDTNSNRAVENQAAIIARQLPVARITAYTGIGILALALLCLVVHFITRTMRRGPAPAEPDAWLLLSATVLGIAGVVILAVGQLRFPDVSLPLALGMVSADDATGDATRPADAATSQPAENVAIDWRTHLAPRGKETRIGDTLRAVVNQERGGPVAGVVIISDGQSNSGMQTRLAASMASEAGIPVYTIAIGDSRPPMNARVVDLEAPERVYPGDRFQLKGYVQSFGMSGQSARIGLMATSADAKPEEEGELLEEKLIELGADGAPVPIEFEATPAEIGKRRYTFRVTPPAEDRDPADNALSANVEVVAEQNRVLLIAGGPMREYHFLRNMLYRDRDTTSVVLLQTGEPGISQESDELIFEFPRTAEELFEYDCIVAFDPDWLALDEQRIRLIEQWVSEQAGGLILIAGPVHTTEWTRMRRGADPRVDLLKALYPVVFITEGSTSINLGKVGGERPWPLDFSRDGRSEKFLWLEDDETRSEEAWSSFPGVYGYFAVRDVKKGSRVYARFSDPQERSLDEEQPVYFAGQFYGSGRVFFAASGEMWRLRAINEEYFQRFYTKLVRWASQGRLLRDSSRGVLRVEPERCFLGDRVTANAVLTDAQRQPLAAEHVEAFVVQPDGQRVRLELRRVQESEREGQFQGQFTPTMEGDYRIELAPPQSVEDLLVQEVRCSSSAAETRQPMRKDSELKEISDRTRGRFYDSLQVAMAGQGSDTPSLLAALEPQDQETRLPGTPDRKFKLHLNMWLMGLIAGVLSLEWLIRRLNKLA